MGRAGRLFVVFASVLTFVGCSDDGHSASAVEVFASGGPNPTFSIPAYRPSRCSFDNKAAATGVVAATGRAAWTTEIPWVADAEPVTDGNALFIAARATEDVLAIRLADGRPLWRRALAMSFGPLPLHLKDGIILTREERGNDGSAIVAFSASDGADRWQHELGGGLADIQVGDSLVYAIDGGGKVHAYEFSSGDERWSVDAGQSGPEMHIGVGSGLLFAADDLTGSVTAFDAVTGTKRWTTASAHRLVALVGSIGPVLVTLLTDIGDDLLPRGVRLVGISVADGSEKWSRPTQVVDADRIDITPSSIFLEEDGLASLDPEDGHVRWQLPEPIVEVTALGDGRVAGVSDQPMMQSFDSELLLFDADQGSVQWRAPLVGRPRSRPLVAGDLIAVGTGRDATSSAVDDAHDGVLTAFNLDDGVQRWTLDTRDAVEVTPVAAGSLLAVVSSDPLIFCD